MNAISMDKKLNHSLYRQIAEGIRSSIRKGELVPGERLPAERRLAAQLGVSPGMVAKAMALLVDEGLVSRRRGSGTIVADIDPSGVTRPRTQNIGLVFANVIGAFINDIIMGIQNDIDKRDYHTFLCDCGNEVEREIKHINSLIDRGVDGLLIYPVARKQGASNSYAHYRRLLHAGIPFVFLERYHRNIDTDYVVFDYYNGTREAVAHLAELGHRRIAFITEPLNVTSLADRLRGYRDGLRQCRIKPDSELVKYCERSAIHLDKIVDELLAAGVTAIICFSDVFAYRVLRILQARQVSVPGQISLVGYGRRDTELIYPDLTVVWHSAYDLGRKAAEVLFARLSSGEGDTVGITLDTVLEVGDSTAPIA